MAGGEGVQGVAVAAGAADEGPYEGALVAVAVVVVAVVVDRIPVRPGQGPGHHACGRRSSRSIPVPVPRLAQLGAGTPITASEAGGNPCSRR